jgi:hypothetical protein
LANYITITPTRILVEYSRDYLRYSGNITKFDSLNRYLKTDPTGNIQVGGYESCPTFYGDSTNPTAGISDKDKGWWPTDLLRGSFYYNDAFNEQIYLDIPDFTSWKQVNQAPQPTVNTGYGTTPCYSSFQNITVDGVNVGVFRWSAAWGATGELDAEGNPYMNLMITPVIASLNGARSGLAKFTWLPINNWQGIYNDPYGNSYGISFYDQHSIVNYYGQRVWRFPSPVFNKMCIMFTKTPSTLSLAVTS